MKLTTKFAKLKYYIRKCFDKLQYIQDEYGHTEATRERTIFRFWFYTSYWHYLISKFNVFRKFDNYEKDNYLHYLTCVIPHNVGIGHQLACWNSALLFSIKYDLIFVHYPLSEGLG